MDSYENFLKNNYMKNNTLYDMYIYDFKDTNIFGPYLLDLKNNLPEEYIDMYDSRIVKTSCFYEEELVGLVKSLTMNLYIYINNNNNNYYNNN